MLCLASDRRVAAVLASLTVTAVVVTLCVGDNAFGLIDFRVYLAGGAHAFSGDLYTFSGQTPEDLPFTYPPFAALAFVPLAALPLLLAKVLWALVIVAALVVAVDRMLRWLRADTVTGVHLLPLTVSVCAVAFWAQPVRASLAYGQINTLLMALILLGATSRRRWPAGVSVGVAAGLKLIPVATVAYYAVLRRWGSALAGVAVFAGTAALGLVLLPDETRHYFGDLLLKPDRAGAVWEVNNQSLQGAIDRLAGHESKPLWLAASVVAAALTAVAAVGLARAGDAPGCLMAVQVGALLVSPISWDHHWVWAVPLALWGWVRAAQTGRTAPAVLAWLWSVLTLSNLLTVRLATKHEWSGPSRTGVLAWLDAAYPLAGVATLVLLAVAARRQPPALIETGCQARQVSNRPA